MHAITILRRCLNPLLENMHARRLSTLLEAAASCVSGPALSLTDVGRRFAGDALLRNKIKRSDRLLGNRHLQRLGERLPSTAAPIIVADSGFKVPFYREVERLGWRWVGRVRGRDDVRVTTRWASCQSVFRRATGKPTGIGEALSRSVPHPNAVSLALERRRERREQSLALHCSARG